MRALLQKRPLLDLLSIAALVICGASGCSGSVCQDACERQKKCANELHCETLPAERQAGCNWNRQQFQEKDCSEIKTCAGQELAVAQQINSCSFNALCDCTETTDGPRVDILCRRPPTISSCKPPPNNYSQDKWWCSGCGSCEGMTPVAACSLARNNDCRYFATSCIPAEYHLCDGTGDKQTNFLCGYCFLSEQGVKRIAECNHLPDLGWVYPADLGK